MAYIPILNVLSITLEKQNRFMRLKIFIPLSLILSILIFFIFLKLTNNLYFLSNVTNTSIDQSKNEAKTELDNQDIVQPLTLETIFNNKPPVQSDNIISLITTGDVMLGRSVNIKIKQFNNSDWPFLNISQLLKSADITFINLESPFSNPCSGTNSGMIFCSENNNVRGLVNSGVDLANIANNHILNYQNQGMINTINLLNQNHILPVGTSDPIYFNAKEIKFAFISFEDVEPNNSFLTKTEEKQIAEKIDEGHKKADIVVVAFHWGVEYTSQPTNRQIKLAHYAIDQGADIIIGNHPHWIQPIEIYKEKPIIYSHGNLIFDQMWSEKTRQGIISKFTFNNNQLMDLELIPIIIENYGQPRILDGEDKQKILDDIKNQSNILKSTSTNF